MEEDPLQLLEAAVFAPELWPQALETMGRAHNAQIFSLMRESAAGLELLAAPHAEDARETYIREGWFEHDVRSQRGVRYRDQFSFMTDDVLTAPDERTGGLFYRDFAARFDVPHCLAWRFTYGDETYIWTYMRSKAAGEAAEEDKARVRPVVARASAAAILASKAAKTRVLGLIDGLNAAGTAALVLGPRAAVVDATIHAEALFCSDFDVSGARIRIGDRNAAAGLRALDDALSPKGAGASLRGFAFETQKGRMLALPMRLASPAMDFFSGVRAILVLKPLRPQRACNPDLLRLAYPLTEGEADIAAWIGAGLTLEEIARTRSVKIDTVRSMVKSILQKTGLRRQAELAGVVAALGR